MGDALVADAYNDMGLTLQNGHNQQICSNGDCINYATGHSTDGFL